MSYEEQAKLKDACYHDNWDQFLAWAVKVRLANALLENVLSGNSVSVGFKDGEPEFNLTKDRVWDK